MATTAIFAEILIVGLQAMVWLGIAVAAVADVSWTGLTSLSDWDSLITVLVLATAYALGIVVDRAADSVFDPWDRRLRRKNLPEKASLPSASTMRLAVLAQEDGTARFLDYVRSRVRVARATAFNLAFIVGAALLYVLLKPSQLGGVARERAIAIVAGVGLPLLLLAIFAWMRITKTYYWRLSEAYVLLQEGRSGAAQQADAEADAAEEDSRAK